MGKAGVDQQHTVDGGQRAGVGQAVAEKRRAAADRQRGALSDIRGAVDNQQPALNHQSIVRVDAVRALNRQTAIVQGESVRVTDGGQRPVAVVDEGQFGVA